MSDAAIIASPAPAAPAPPPPASGPSLWSPGGFGFKDLLDIVNPLQHLPIIGSVYRYLTGDEPSGGARIVGDTLYGGPIGFGVGVVSTLLTDSQGHDLGEKALAAVFGPSSAEASAAAKANPPPVPNAAQTALPLPQSAAATATRPPATVPLPADPTRLAAQLYRSPTPPQPVVPANSPEQKFLAQTSRFQRQLTTTEATNGRVLNNRPVPLELSGNLMPARRLDVVPATGPRPAGPGASTPESSPQSIPALNPIARKMLDALDKYEQIKKQQAQEDSLKAGGQAQTDLSL